MLNYKPKIETMFKNGKDWRTTVPTFIGLLMTIIGTLMPDRVTPEDVAAVNLASVNIVNGLGTLILVATGIFSRGGTE
jgi:hypothetical protein